MFSFRKFLLNPSVVWNVLPLMAGFSLRQSPIPARSKLSLLRSLHIKAIGRQRCLRGLWKLNLSIKFSKPVVQAEKVNSVSIRDWLKLLTVFTSRTCLLFVNYGVCVTNLKSLLFTVSVVTSYSTYDHWYVKPSNTSFIIPYCLFNPERYVKLLDVFRCYNNIF